VTPRTSIHPESKDDHKKHSVTATHGETQDYYATAY